LRLARRMTQEQLAKKIKTTTCCVSNHEKTGITTIETLLKYCEALGCEPAELLSESFEPENYTLIAEITSFYPWNLIRAVVGDIDGVYKVYVPAFKECVAKLTLKEQRILELRFVHGFTYEKVGHRFNVTRERTRQIEAKALRKLRNPVFRKKYLMDTLNKAFEIDRERARLERENGRMRMLLEKHGYTFENNVPKKPPIDIADMDLSIRSFNCLRRAGINYVDDLEGMTIEKLKKVRNLGWKSISEVVKKAKEFGIEIPESEGDTDEH